MLFDAGTRTCCAVRGTDGQAGNPVAMDYPAKRAQNSERSSVSKHANKHVVLFRSEWENHGWKPNK
jgi:hypothetical protein